MRSQIIMIFVCVCTMIVIVSVSSAYAQNQLKYQGFTISKYSNSKTNTSTVVIRKGKRTLANHDKGFGEYRASEFELRPILGKKEKQLIITQFSGGAHCCRIYWVYDLKPSFRLLFQSTDFAIGDGGESGEGKFQNLDNDKELELVERNDAFLYFDDLAYVSSPRPLLIFDYSPKHQKFELANKRFASYILKDEQVWIKRAADVKNTNPAQFGADMFSIFLDYIYAGKETEAWKFYYGNKDVRENGWFHSEAKVRKIVKNDRTYQLINKK